MKILNFLIDLGLGLLACCFALAAIPPAAVATALIVAAKSLQSNTR